MREIEVKAKLRDEAGFMAAAKRLGITFNEPIEQSDTTYEKDVPYDDPAWNIFRIREQGDKLVLTMKHRASSRSRDNHEYETTIGDADQIKKMLARVGHVHGVHVQKQRRTAHYEGLELCLDIVDKFGAFVEVEKLADDNADVDEIQKELWELLQKLGVNPEDRIHKGYDMLMYDYLAQTAA